MKQRIWIFIFSIILCVILTGCIKKDERGKKQKVVYVVCRRSVIPVQLGKLIDEQKREAFHFTYTTGGFTYYVIGYGRQPGSGYKIKVREFSADRTHIYIDTILTGYKRAPEAWKILSIYCTKKPVLRKRCDFSLKL